jgi:hypothetical protein
MTARVQRQIAGLFVAEERGSHEFKSVPEPVTLFQLVRASGGGRRSGQRHLTLRFIVPAGLGHPVEIAFDGSRGGSRMWPEHDVAVVVFRPELAFVLKPLVELHFGELVLKLEVIIAARLRRLGDRSIGTDL